MKGLFLLLCLRWVAECVYIDEDDGFGLEEPLSAKPRLVVGEWTGCSTSCGNGVESRSLECRVSHPLAGHLKLPLHECGGTIPPLFRPCFTQPCALKEEERGVIREEYHWKHSEWSTCSATCLGGKQRALLQCIHVSSGNSVAWSACDARRRPREETRSCNERACPPEWVVSEWSSCLPQCGATRIRDVSCISTTTKAGGAVGRVRMEETACPSEKPPHSQPCPDTHCHGWKVGEWSGCSSSCGRGEETRRVVCSLSSPCPLPQPSERRMCEKHSCPQEDQEDREENNKKKLTLGLGGHATIFEGTSIKVKCPRKDEDVQKMYWLKDGERLANNRHIKVSSNGNLRISNARMEDAGLYECVTPSGLKGNVTIRFKLREDQKKEVDGVKLSGGKKLKKGKAKYKSGPWLQCHQSHCQLRGIQERRVECFVHEGKSPRAVSLSICESLNMTRPPTSRPCSRLDCSTWNATHWSPCNSSRCVRKWTSEQTRKVECLSSNGRSLDPSHCDLSSKPALTTLCANPSCTAEWKTSEWNECSSNCGTGGVQLRLLHCVWSKTGKPGGKACDGLQQPRTTRACRSTHPLPACTPPRKDAPPPSDCEDLSRFCDIIKLFHSCESEHVIRRCCATCTQLEKKTSLI